MREVRDKAHQTALLIGQMLKTKREFCLSGQSIISTIYLKAQILTSLTGTSVMMAPELSNHSSKPAQENR